jgi:hypothetical protein
MQGADSLSLDKRAAPDVVVPRAEVADLDVYVFAGAQQIGNSTSPLVDVRDDPDHSRPEAKCALEIVTKECLFFSRSEKNA